MYTYREEKIKRICILLCILLVGILAVTVFIVQKNDAEKQSHLQEIAAQVQPYRQELAQLTKELNSLKFDSRYTSQYARLMIGFRSTGVSDLAYIREKALVYQFTPVLILDCSVSMPEIGEVVMAADPDWEIILYIPDYMDGMIGHIQDVRDYLNTVGRPDSDILFLRENHSAQTLDQILTQNNFQGSVTYHNTPISGQNKNGTVYFDYSYFKKDVFVKQTIGALQERLNLWYTARSSMLCVFDMSILNDEDVTEEQIDRVLNSIRQYTAYDYGRFSTVNEVVTELSQINRIEAELTAEANRKASQLQARIDALNAIIDSYYH